MIILAIETSCDETAIALVKKDKGFRILSNVVASQVEIHRPYGGVYPSLAKREHQKNLPMVFKKALKEAKNPDIDAIAVTVGPGLDPCLWEGVNFAKKLAQDLELPIIPVNHLEAHIIVNFVDKVQSPKFKVQSFPAICLVISGGHTQLVLMRDFGKYQILGETRDDAAGECFDKTASVLGLPYPGGPAIAKIANLHKSDSRIFANNKFVKISDINLPRPMIYSKDYDFSFSGLKTAVLYDFKKRSQKVRKSKEYIQEMAAEIQQAIIDVLIKKTIKAAKDYQAKSIILGGGVAANDELRRQLSNQLSIIDYQLNFLVPPKKFCTDNAAMIGVTAFYHLNQKQNWQKITADANLRL